MLLSCRIFFFNDTATTEIYTLSLHDALPISGVPQPASGRHRRRWGLTPRSTRCEGPHRQGCRTEGGADPYATRHRRELGQDRKSTRLNSSHANISYAVFCLKKKKNKYKT